MTEFRDDPETVRVVSDSKRARALKDTNKPSVQNIALGVAAVGLAIFLLFVWPGPWLMKKWTGKKPAPVIVKKNAECQAIVDSVCILDTTYWRPRNGYMVPVFGPQDSIIPTLFKSLRKDSVIKLKFYRRPQ